MNRVVKPVVAALAFAVAAGPVAEAGSVGKARPRVVRESYSPNPYDQIVVNYLDPGVSVTSVPIPLRTGETLVSVKLTDDSGDPVRGTVYQRDATYAKFCGKTDEPVPVDPSRELLIEVFAGPCEGAMSLPTQGVVEVKIFSSRREL